MPTQLVYAIQTTPIPLTAAATDASITLLATNETDQPVSIEGVIIRIPVGKAADDLTDLPQQILAVPPQGWPPAKIKRSPGHLEYIFVPSADAVEMEGVITPAEQEKLLSMAEMANPQLSVPAHSNLTFVLDKIAVNGKEGTVELLIKEGSLGEPKKVIDLPKFPASWGTISFAATPPNLTGPGDVSLQWNGPEGATYTIEYIDPRTQQIVNLPASGQPPLSNTGTYPGPSDPKLHISATTLFTLTVTKVIEGRTFTFQPQQIVSVSVVPTITSFTGRIEGTWPKRKLLLSWETTDCEYVTASWVNGEELAANPTKPIFIEPPFTGDYTITAWGAGGVKSEPATFSLQFVPLHTVPVGQNPQSIVISPDGKYAFVANFTAATVSVIAMQEENMPVIHTIKVFGSEPNSITISPNGEYAFVTNWPSSKVSVIAIKEENMPVIHTIDAEYGASATAFSPDGKYAFVPNAAAITVTVIAIQEENMPVVHTIGVGQYPVMIAITPDGKYAIVVNNGSATISFIAIQEDNMPVIHTISYSLELSAPNSIAISPDGKYAFVPDSITNAVFVIAIQEENMPIINQIGLLIQEPHAITISPDGKYAFVTCRITNTVVVIAIQEENMPILHSIKVGQTPKSTIISPNGAYALVNNADSDTVSVVAIQEENMPVVQTIKVGEYPDGIAFSPTGEYALVTNFNSNTVSVLGYGLAAPY
ncbi:MAG: YncE family protein [Bacteroidota bacterium]